MNIQNRPERRMRTLTQEEMNIVSGGGFPLIPIALALIASCLIIPASTSRDPHEDAMRSR